MILSIVIAASFLLGLILYPILSGAYARFIIGQYRKLGIDKISTVEKTDKRQEASSIMGKSKTIITGHSRTKAATAPDNEKVIEKEDTFVPEAPEDAGRMDQVSIPLEKEDDYDGKAREAEFDPQEEETALETGQDAVLASGASYDQLMDTGRVIAKEEPSDKEKDRAGAILYENESTQIVEQIVSNDKKTLAKVNDLIRFYMEKHNLHTDESADNVSSTDDLENFDVKQLF